MTKLLLILSFTFGVAFTAFADKHYAELGKSAAQILKYGTILHKEVHYQGDSHVFYEKYRYYTAHQIHYIQFVVLHDKSFYDCWVRHEEDEKANAPYLDSVDCRLLKQNKTFESDELNLKPY